MRTLVGEVFPDCGAGMGKVLSEDTIRRDLRELAQEGLLQRVHGERYRLRRPLRILPAGSAPEDGCPRTVLDEVARSADDRVEGNIV